MSKNNKNIRIGEERLNNQGCPMIIVEYLNWENVTVEFKDKYAIQIKTNYQAFERGNVKNPYYPSVCGIGMIGVKYPVSINCKAIKEYQAWRDMLKRCTDNRLKEKYSTYQNVTCCEEWLCYENFYEWLHSQENLQKWLNGEKWEVDKDIIKKKNKVYSPDTCCLVPHNVNCLFIKSNATRGILPIGIKRKGDRFEAVCANPFTNRKDYLGAYLTIDEAFLAYKNRKEEIIKQVAQEEYNKGNITQKCYNAMICYEVNIDD